jgi:hypothetical protein
VESAVLDEDASRVLSGHKVALCAADTEEGGAAAEVIPTADWGYLRLRRADNGEEQLRNWADRIRAQPWQDQKSTARRRLARAA